MVGESRKVILALLSAHAMDLHVYFFKMIMGHNSDPILREENDLNPFIRMWCKVSGSPFLKHKLSEFIKLAEITIILVLVFVKDECTFNIMAFMKTKLHNQLSTHLDLCTRFHTQHFFIL
jgi:hypothetical protein